MKLKYLYTVIMLTLIPIFLQSCASNKVIETSQSQEDIIDVYIQKGMDAWNTKDPSFAIDYWSKISDATLQKDYLNYVYSYQEGVNELDTVYVLDTPSEIQLLESCRTVLSLFSVIDASLILPVDTIERGTDLACKCIDNLLVSEKIDEAEKLYNSAVKVYGNNEKLRISKKEYEIVRYIMGQKEEIKKEYDKANISGNLDIKIKEYDNTYSLYKTAEINADSKINESKVGDISGVIKARKSLRSLGQNIKIAREKVIREKAYTYREKISDAFSRKPTAGTGKKGAVTSEDILSLYRSIQREIEGLYAELTEFRNSYPDTIGHDIMDEIKTQKNTLNLEISKITKEVQNQKEIASRGKSVFPVMIGLFNSEVGQSDDNKKSKPATFSANDASKDEYWWGMIEIPNGVMNDLVITLKDNRTVRVFNENTNNGKNIAKKDNDTKKLHDLVNQNSRIGNSWPVLNAGKQLNSNVYYFEVQKGKTESYSGEAVIYSSFITRMR